MDFYEWRINRKPARIPGDWERVGILAVVACCFWLVVLAGVPAVYRYQLRAAEVNARNAESQLHVPTVEEAHIMAALDEAKKETEPEENEGEPIQPLRYWLEPGIMGISGASLTSSNIIFEKKSVGVMVISGKPVALPAGGHRRALKQAFGRNWKSVVHRLNAKEK